MAVLPGLGSRVFPQMLIIETRAAGHHLCSRHSVVKPQPVSPVAPACNQSPPCSLMFGPMITSVSRVLGVNAVPTVEVLTKRTQTSGDRKTNATGRGLGYNLVARCLPAVCKSPGFSLPVTGGLSLGNKKIIDALTSVSPGP